MQIRLIPAIILFVGSYFPLALIMGVQNVHSEYWGLPFCRSIHVFVECQLPKLQNPVLVWSFLIITLGSLIFFLQLLKRLPASSEMTIEESKTIPNDLINYVFPYIVSFMGVELSATGKVLGLGLFMLWMFMLCYRSGQILMNPLLLINGWQLYEVRADIEGKKRSLRALSKENIAPKQTLKSCLVQGIYVLSKANGK